MHCLVCLTDCMSNDYCITQIDSDWYHSRSSYCIILTFDVLVYNSCPCTRNKGLLNLSHLVLLNLLGVHRHKLFVQTWTKSCILNGPSQGIRAYILVSAGPTDGQTLPEHSLTPDKENLHHIFHIAARHLCTVNHSLPYSLNTTV